MKLGAMIYSFSPAIRSGEMTQRQVIELCAEIGLACVDTMVELGGGTGVPVYGEDRSAVRSGVNLVPRRAVDRLAARV